MMNSYILIKKEPTIKKDSNKNVIVIQKNIEEYLKNEFHLLKDELYNIDNNRTELLFSIDEKDINKVFKVSVQRVNANIYMYIETNVKLKKDKITILEKVNSFIKNNDELGKNYNIVCSYDSLSEYYSNRIFPKLNEYERLLKRLLFNVYTINFRGEYINTIEDEIKDKAKKNIKQKNHINNVKDNKLLIEEFFYSIDLNDIEKILFTPKWTEYDENSKNKFLKRNPDLTKLTNEQLHKFVDECCPKSDWNRFFLNKKMNNNFEEKIDQIRKFRNDVDHCKLLNKDEFTTASELLDDVINQLKVAIEISEQEDFSRKNKEYLLEQNERIHELIIKLLPSQEDMKLITESINTSMEPIRKIAQQLSENMKSMMSPLYETSEKMKTILEPIQKNSRMISEGLRNNLGLNYINKEEDK